MRSGCLRTLSTVLNWMGRKPAFIADLVDIDADQDTGAVRHCGLAPEHVTDPDALEAGIHSNRNPWLMNFQPAG